MKITLSMFNRILFFLLVIFALGFFGSTNANSASVKINGKIGGEVTAESSTMPEESASTDSSEELASPKEETILLGRLPNTGEHRIYLLTFIGLGALLLFALASNRKGKDDE